MHKLLGMSVLGMALALAGCGGGDSDSSGHNNDVDKKKETSEQTEPTKPSEGGSIVKLYNKATDNACTINAEKSEVYATKSGCKFAHPNLQNGTALTYTCIGDKVKGSQGGLNIEAKTINLSIGKNKATVLCKS
ncbi:hypothetical protein [Psychrobacter sp. I-STPA10]|uniref:hypothetical protein n=1 Tax=Psychrobacter sp. I-STPA10 TaxID=2585769 RepID=UPI001E5FC3AF|nr:hypothetical protein [Psychrobacter sp. I-STPA10]